MSRPHHDAVLKAFGTYNFKQKISVSTIHCSNYVKKQNVCEDEIAFTVNIPNEQLRNWHDLKQKAVLGRVSYVQILNAFISHYGIAIKEDSERMNGLLRRICSEAKKKSCRNQGRFKVEFLGRKKSLAVHYNELESMSHLQESLKCAKQNAENISKENEDFQERYDKLYQELQFILESQKKREQKLGHFQSEYDKLVSQNKELREYIEKTGLLTNLCNTGRKINEVRERQQRRKLKELKTNVEKALWFAETYGLKLEFASFIDEDGKDHDLVFTDASKNKAFKNLPEDERDKIKQILFIQDKFCVGEAAYHELTMTPAGEGLPRSYLIKQCKDSLNELCHIERTPGKAEGAQVNFKNELSKVITKHMKDTGVEDPSNIGKIKVKLSGDGAKMTRLTNFVIISFSILNDETAVLSSKGNHTVAVIKGTESYELLQTSCYDVFRDVNDIVKDGFINIDGINVPVELFLGGDYKFLLLIFGMKAATSDFACIWCKIHKLFRYDMSKPMDFYWQEHNKRTLQDIVECAHQLKLSCQYQPLLNIPLENVVLDELHLMLRVTDKLTRNLVEDAIRRDGYENDHENGKKIPTHLDSLINAIRSCGITFSVWEKKNVDLKGNKTYDFTSLMGPDKKTLLEKLPSRLDGVISPETSDTVIKIWKDFNEIYKNMIQKRDPTDEDIDNYFSKVKAWVELFTSLDGQMEGHSKANVTPYMHAMVYHVPRFMKLHKGIKKFSGQGVEKLNDGCRRIHLVKSNKWDAAKDVLLVGKRLELLEDFERKPRQYNKRSDHYWSHSIKESRAKRSRVCSQERMLSNAIPSWNSTKCTTNFLDTSTSETTSI